MVSFLRSSIMCISSIAAATAPSPPTTLYTSFRPGLAWTDTEGDTIHAHSGGLLDDYPRSNVTYWYGSEGYPGGDAMLNTKINVYSTTDLYNWKQEGVAFEMPQRTLCNTSQPSHKAGQEITCYADRCHVLYHEASALYIMWCKAKPFVSVRAVLCVRECATLHECVCASWPRY
jgi:hypothetical protein